MERIWQWIVSGSLWRHLAVTLEGIAAGLLLGAALGIFARLFRSRGRRFSRACSISTSRLLNAVPRVVLAPLFLVVFGLGIGRRSALVTLVFFVMFFKTTYQGCAMRRVLIDNCACLGATERQLVRHVLIPSASRESSRASRRAWIRDGGGGVGEYLGATARSRFRDLAGGGHLRHDRRLLPA